MSNHHDPLADRFRAKGHPYPELVRELLQAIWVGPKRNDFAAPIIMAARKHLEKHDLPHERGDAINAIRNRILQRDWGWLEQRQEEGEALSAAASRPIEPNLVQANAPQLLSEMTDDERAASLAAIQEAKQIMKRSRHV
jgi:hypothetical protein